MKNKRVYVDTSVFGGVYDDEFKIASKKFFEKVEKGDFLLVTSAIVEGEIVVAPTKVVALFEQLVKHAQVVDVSEAALDLREKYLKKEIVSKKYSDDALHVAIATVSECEMIISWNFKLIVHYDKIASYNAVNVKNGYSSIDIFSTLEVIDYDEEI